MDLPRNVTKTPNVTQRTAKSAFDKVTRAPKATNEARIETILEIYAQAQAGRACKVGMEVETYTGYTPATPTRTRKVTNPHWPVENESGQARTSRVAAALRICAGCNVQKECENYATMKKPLDDGFVLGGIYFSTPRLITPATRSRQAIYETVPAMRRRIVADRITHDAKITTASKIRGMAHLAKFKIIATASIRIMRPDRYTLDHSVTFVRDVLADLLIGRLMTNAELDGNGPTTLDDVTFDEMPAHIRAASNADRMSEKEEV